MAAAAAARTSRQIPSLHSTRRTSRTKSNIRFRLSSIITAVSCTILLLYFAVSLALFQKTLEDNDNNKNSNGKPQAGPQSQRNVQQDQQTTIDGNYTYDSFRDLAIQLAGLSSPTEILEQLRSKDPFGVRAFEQDLLERETALGRLLTTGELQELFPCPLNRITLPDARNMTQAIEFRKGTRGYFIFFQHLRKAGGTQFCTLVEHNFPRSRLPKYYCMPDYRWNDSIGSAGSLHHYSNKVIAHHIWQDQHVIAGNEWDSFDRLHHFDLPAVFVTSFRKPLDRALSQFRFECVEDRGCKVQNIEDYWERRKDLYNIYTRTFADPAKKLGLQKAYTGSTAADRRWRQELMRDALDTIRQFHLVTSMEFIAYAEPMVQAVLGFQTTSELTQRVRPHIGQFERRDGQEENKLGAAGVKKASWNPETYLSRQQYKSMSETLALDEILTDAAWRFFLERLVCQEY